VFYFYSYLWRRPVLGRDARLLGHIEDFTLTSVGDLPKVSGLLVRSRSGLHFVGWDKVASLSDKAVYLREASDTLMMPPPPENVWLLARDVLDAQVVDVNGAKVLRVNDAQLQELENELFLTGVDLGLWGIARRLGFAVWLAWLSRTFRLRVPEGLVAWGMVEAIDKGRAPMQLKVTHDRLIGMHPADLAEIMGELGHEQRMNLLLEMTDEQVADMVEEAEPDLQAVILDELGEDRAADVLEEMDPDEAAHVLQELPEEDAERLIELMDRDDAAEVQALLSYEEDTAGSLMTTEFLAVPAALTVGEALLFLRRSEEEPEATADLYLIENDRLMGVLSLHELIRAEPVTPLRELAEAGVHKVAPNDDKDTVIELMHRYSLTGLPVVQPDGRMIGVVTITDVLDLLMPERS
jgi:CBS domain-containing protein